MSKFIRAGVDIAKSVFHVNAVDRTEKLKWQAKLSRNKWIDELCTRLAPGTEVAMEVCAAAHHWGRVLQNKGFSVKLIAAQFVKPYVN